MASIETNARIVLPSGEVWSEIYRANGGYVLDWKRAARFQIAADGSRMRCRTYPSAALVSVSILRDLAVAYARSLQGRESLHATALIPRDASWAVAFLGGSGAGKSTLSAYLMREGWRLLSDDAPSVSIRHGLARVSSTAQRLKLSNKSAGLTGWEPGLGEFDPNLEKRVFRLPEDRRNYPLKALFLLSRDQSSVPKLRRVHGAKAALILQASYYNILLRPPQVLRRQFDLAARLGRIVPVWRLSYPSGFRHLPGVRSLLESFLGGFHADPGR